MEEEQLFVTLRIARTVAQNIRYRKNIDRVDCSRVAESLKILAEHDSKSDFKKLIDNYKALAERTGDGDLKTNPLGFLEFLCAGMDSSFTQLGYCSYTGTTPPLGTTQRYFRDLYGSHLSLNL